jgi:hypothetical protein
LFLVYEVYAVLLLAPCYVFETLLPGTKGHGGLAKRQAFILVACGEGDGPVRGIQ